MFTKEFIRPNAALSGRWPAAHQETSGSLPAVQLSS
jgi:hypothetical protein